MAGKVRNCVVCGQLCADVNGGMCQRCYNAEQDRMEAISSYVRDHPDSKVKEIAAALDVKESLIMRMMREGRFVMNNGRPFEYPCEKCGEPITFGRLCDVCSAKLSQEALVVQKKLEGKASGMVIQPEQPFTRKKQPPKEKSRGEGMRSIGMGNKFTGA